jgi:hypothetical protein
MGLIYRIMNNFGPITEHRRGEPLVALIGDIVDSKRIEDRAAFQRKLRGTLDEINGELAPGVLAARLDLAAGDEIQGLFRRPEAVVPVVTRLADALAPERLVVGVGRGGLTTDPSPRVSEMDGPCFHHARDALESARKDDAWVGVKGFGESADVVLGALFLLIHTLRSRWTDKQAQYARAARQMLRKEFAARFQVSPSVVSESLKSAAFDAVRAGEAALAQALRDFGPETEHGSDSGLGVNS